MKLPKKNYFFILSIILLLISCSKDKDDSFENSLTGLKKPKTITIVNNNGFTQVINLQYEGNNLKKFTISNLPNIPEYFYQNGILTEFKELASSSEKYYYDNTGKLSQVLEVSSSAYFRADFSYNSGSNKINSAKFYRSATSHWKDISYNYDANGNAIRITNTTSNVFLNRTYDNKNNPFVNVNCELENHYLLKNDWYQSSKNNCLSASGEASTGQRGSATFIYEYDSEDFPIKRIEKNGTIVKQTITYQY